MVKAYTGLFNRDAFTALLGQSNTSILNWSPYENPSACALWYEGDQAIPNYSFGASFTGSNKFATNSGVVQRVVAELAGYDLASDVPSNWSESKVAIEMKGRLLLQNGWTQFHLARAKVFVDSDRAKLGIISPTLEDITRFGVATGLIGVSRE